MTINTQPKYLSLAIGTLLAVSTINVQAAGFAIIEHSAAGMGNAFAGGAAIAEDASTVFFNPAGMTRIEGSQFILAGHIISPTFDYSEQGSYVNPNLTGGTPIAGSLPGKNADGSVVALVPNNYFVTQINDQLSAGLGINAPFGLETEYDKDWYGRYHALQSKIVTININPAVAYKVNDKISLGAGISAQYFKATLSQAIDFGTVCFGIEGGGLLPPGTCAASGSFPLTADGQGKAKASDWSWGFNLGALFEVTDDTRVGVQYRSSISHDAEGRTTFRVPENFPSGSLPLFTDTDASAGIDLPESASISLFHQINQRLAIMGDVTWTNWDRFEELVIEYDNPSQPDSVQPENWESQFRYSLGLTYTPNDEWAFRTGVAYDETAVPDEYRTPRLPGNDRTWVSFGLGHNLSEHMTINMAYSHLFVDDTPIHDTEISTGHTLVGEYESSTDIFSGGLVYKF